MNDITNNTATNMVQGPHTRRIPKTGQGFYLEVEETGFLLGRVITTKGVWSGIDPKDSGYAKLICIYKDVYPTLEQALNGNPTELLTAPMFTNNLPWVRGFLKYLPEDANINFPPLQERYCFVSHQKIDYYYDEHGTPVTEPWQPVGERVLRSYLTIDDEISDALGVTRAYIKHPKV